MQEIKLYCCKEAELTEHQSIKVDSIGKPNSKTTPEIMLLTPK